MESLIALAQIVLCLFIVLVVTAAFLAIIWYRQHKRDEKEVDDFKRDVKVRMSMGASALTPEQRRQAMRSLATVTRNRNTPG